MMPFYALDELDRVLGANAHLRSPGRRFVHDEFDVFRSMARWRIRRLTGGGYLCRGGLAHDVAADIIENRVPGVDGPNAAIDWFVTTALDAMVEHHILRNRRIYDRRRRRAITNGYRSFWHQRSTRHQQDRAA